MPSNIETILKKSTIPAKADALPGRSAPLKISGIHAVNNEPFVRTKNPNESEIILGMGCFGGRA